MLGGLVEEQRCQINMKTISDTFGRMQMAKDGKEEEEIEEEIEVMKKKAKALLVCNQSQSVV